MLIDLPFICLYEYEGWICLFQLAHYRNKSKVYYVGLHQYGGFAIIIMASETLKPVEWLGSSKDDLRKFPGSVQDRIGFAVYQAQIGLKHRDAKPLTGLGSGVVEVVLDTMGILIGPYIRSSSRQLFLFCMPFNRKPSEVLKRRSLKST